VLSFLIDIRHLTLAVLRVDKQADDFHEWISFIKTLRRLVVGLV